MAGLGNDAHTREERSQDSQTNVSAYQWTKTTVLVVFTER
jgi:hypothetical protein